MSERQMATGSCSACGYVPVAFGALACPRCGAQNPNPGVASRFAGRGMLLGLAGGAVVGGAIGWASDRPGMAFGGALLGALPGLCVGLVLGLLAAAVSSLAGRRPGPRRDPVGAADEADLPENVYVQFPVAGLGTDADLGLRLRFESVLDAELRSFGGGYCGGADMGAGKATVFLAVLQPRRTVPRLVDAMQREGLLSDRLVVAEDTGRGYRVWWPEGYRGSFSLL
jgi:hypothetical protein